MRIRVPFIEIKEGQRFFKDDADETECLCIPLSKTINTSNERSFNAIILNTGALQCFQSSHYVRVDREGATLDTLENGTIFTIDNGHGVYMKTGRFKAVDPWGSEKLVSEDTECLPITWKDFCEVRGV